MTDIVDRLRTGFDWDWDCVEPNLGALIQYGDLTDEAADEIERLRQAIKQGQREAAEHILEMWRDPWPRTERSFIDRLEAYVEELK
jgi:F0F1-type ATP synthase membrane subunit b/b'